MKERRSLLMEKGEVADIGMLKPGLRLVNSLGMLKADSTPTEETFAKRNFCEYDKIQNCGTIANRPKWGF